MRSNLRADTILQGRDDLAACGVVLGVSRKDQADIEGKTDRIAFDLDVPLLHDIKQGDLDLGGEIRELVDGKDPSVGPGKEAEVDGQRTAEVDAGPGRPDGVDVTDQISHRHIRSRQFLYVAGIARNIGDGGIICHRGELLLTARTEGRIGVVMDFAPFDGRNLFIQEGGEAPENAALCLSPKPEEDHMVS